MNRVRFVPRGNTRPISIAEVFDQICVCCGRSSCPRGDRCPARNRECNYCNDMGHFAIMCATRIREEQRGGSSAPQRSWRGAMQMQGARRGYQQNYGYRGVQQPADVDAAFDQDLRDFQAFRQFQQQRRAESDQAPGRSRETGLAFTRTYGTGPDQPSNRRDTIQSTIRSLDPFEAVQPTAIPVFNEDDPVTPLPSEIDPGSPPKDSSESESASPKRSGHRKLRIFGSKVHKRSTTRGPTATFKAFDRLGSRSITSTTSDVTTAITLPQVIRKKLRLRFQGGRLVPVTPPLNELSCAECMTTICVCPVPGLE